MKLRAAIAVAALLTVAAFPADSSSGTSAELHQFRAVLATSILEMNADGRLPLSGVSGGMANNIWQTVSHPGEPSRMGCGFQAQYVLDKLAGRFPGWRFEQRYEVGLASPILLPHQWLTAYGPRGAVIQIDPWSGVTQISRGEWQ